MTITGNTNCVGIIGWPVEHSMSPLMHNSAFAAAKLDYVYVPLPVAGNSVEQAVAGIRALGFRGANVTSPYKLQVMPLLDKLDISAQMVGAVNTIVVQEDGVMCGYNTDAEGFARSLLNHKVVLQDRKAVVLGAGGAARAVVWGLIGQGVRDICLGVRDVDKAKNFVSTFAAHVNITVCQWPSEALNEQLASCHLLIHSTPVGMAPVVDEEPSIAWSVLPAGIVVCDLIYAPAVTKFLQRAQAGGHFIINGAGMLVEQGAAAFSLWTGQPAPTAVMYKALGLKMT